MTQSSQIHLFPVPDNSAPLAKSVCSGKMLCMALERTAVDSLQQRIDQIRATGDDDLAGRAWHALSRVLFDHLRNRMPEPYASDVRLYLRRHARHDSFRRATFS
jgi:hypothetical protein